MAVDGGLIQDWKKVNSALRPFCKIITPDDEIVPESDNLALTEFYCLFIVSAVGFTVSVLSFVFELCRLF